MIGFDSLPRHRRSAASLATGVLLLGGALADPVSSTAMTANTASGLSSRSPAQIIAAAQSALRSARGYVMAGAMTQGRQKLTLRLTYGGSARLEMQMSKGPGSASIIALPGSAYIKANRSYWQSQGGGSVVRYANRWIQVPASYGAKFSKQLGQFNPTTLARCLGENHGRLTSAGTTTVAGKRAIVIRDAGGVAGGNPGVLDIAATGPAYPLRVVSTGPTRKGGKVDICNDGKGSNVEGSLTISHFNDPPAIKAPAKPIKLRTP